jgi:tRNA/tmRNA/rRNA uracil-C5-methylase (TrmA/RlmC/RlmD family)
VPFSVEGERLEVRITERKAHHARAEIVQVLAASPSRENPPCPYYGRCGGCQYQHVSYAEECRLKEAQVREAFLRVGKFEDAPVRPLAASPSPYHYRNRITVHAEGGKIGFRGTGGRELIDIRVCLLARDRVNEELAKLRVGGPAEGHFSLRDATVPPSGFFQANHDLRDVLRDLVAGTLPDRGALLAEGYCGGGFLTERMAGRFEQVVAVDNDPRTLRDARRLDLKNVTWEQGDAAVLVPDLLREWRGREVTVVVDPPREGLPLRLTEALCLEAAGRLTYVSCDPATLARDARMLAKSYRLLSVQPIDLFPRTAQIECVSVWDRR